MRTAQFSLTTRIPTVVFLVTPLLYGGAVGLHALFPIFGERYLLDLILYVIPLLLFLSTSVVGIHLIPPSRTWPLAACFVLNLITLGFALSISYLAHTFLSAE